MGKLGVRDSVLFDLDGTLWDASAACAEAWTRALNDVGYSGQLVGAAEVRRFTGLPIDSILDDYFPLVQSEVRPRLLERYLECETEAVRRQGGRLYPDTEEVLTRLHQRHRLFVVSNGLKGYVENFFRLSGLGPLFDGWESLGRSGRPKAENIASVVAAFELRSPIYVGDTAHDGEAAAASQVPFVFANYGFGTVEAPSHSISSLGELLELLES